MPLPILIFFQNFKKDAVHRIAAPYSIEQDSLIYWRSHILFTIIMTGWVFGTIAIIASLELFVRKNAWELALLDVSCFFLCMALIFLKGIRYEVRASIALLIFCAIGNMVIISIGPLSGGPLWLFTFAVLVAVLLGLKPALFAILINAFSLLAIGWLIAAGKIVNDFPYFETPQMTLSFGTNFLVLNVITAFSIAALVKGLVSTHNQERAFSE